MTTPDDYLPLPGAKPVMRWASPDAPWCHLNDPENAPEYQGPDVLECVLSYLDVEAEDWLEIGSSGLRWWATAIPVEISIEPARMTVGVPVIDLRARWNLVRDVAAEDEQVFALLARRNRWIGMGALVWYSDDRRIDLVASDGTYAKLIEDPNGDVPVFFDMVKLLCSKAGELAVRLAADLQGTAAEIPHPVLGIRTDTDASVSLVQDEVEDSRNDHEPRAFDAIRVVGQQWFSKFMVGDNTDEMAYYEAAFAEPPTDIYGHEEWRDERVLDRDILTSFLSVRRDRDHPDYGAGFEFRLEVPWRNTYPEGTDDELARTTNHLNHLMADLRVGIPLTGAWCIDTTRHDDGDLAYFGFIPMGITRDVTPYLWSFFYEDLPDFVRDQILPSETAAAATELLQELTATYQSMAAQNTQLLDSTSDGEPADDSATDQALLRWGIFNPFGPTVLSIVVRKGDEGSRELLFVLEHPFTPFEEVLEVLDDDQDPLDVVQTAFADNGDAFGVTLIGSLPTWVGCADTWVASETLRPTLDRAVVRGLFWSALPAVEPQDFAYAVERLREFPTDPWGAVGSPEDLIENVLGDTGAPLSWPPERSMFDEWFDLVTDPDHLQAELEEMPVAWDGAVRFNRRESNEVEPGPWFSLEAPAPPGTEDLGPQVLAGLEEQLIIDPDWIEHGERRFTWWGGPLPLEVQVAEPAFLNSGEPMVRVEARCVAIDTETLDQDVLELIDGLNTVSSVSSWSYDQQACRVTATTTAYFHPGNLSFQRVHRGVVLLGYEEALDAAARKASELGISPLDAPHPTSGPRVDRDELLRFTDEVLVPGGREPCMYRPDYFADVASYWTEGGLLATAGDDGVTVEFPYATDGSSTSLYTLWAHEHPELGVGLASTLRFAHSWDARDSMIASNLLNSAEATRSLGFPAIGAWSRDAAGGVQHTAFYPNVWADPGLPLVISYYESLRSKWLHDVMVTESYAINRQDL